VRQRNSVSTEFIEGAGVPEVIVSYSIAENPFRVTAAVSDLYPPLFNSVLDDNGIALVLTACAVNLPRRQIILVVPFAFGPDLGNSFSVIIRRRVRD
jgi:hypothetical protein